MALNTKLMFSSETDCWETPQDFFDVLNEDVKSYATKTRVYEMKKQMMLVKFKIRIREV